MKKTTLVLAISVFVLESESTWAYDEHHPDPMSILNGNHFRHRRTPKKKATPDTPKLQPWRMHKRTSEGKYIIKPEPYSIAKQQKDPELLGPQRTYTSAGTENNQTHPALPEKQASPITRERCIKQIGTEKFNAYVQKYGGEAGAIQRCRILLRAHS